MSSALSPIFIWMGIASTVMFVGTLVVVPLLAARIPEDYFIGPRRPLKDRNYRNPALNMVLLVLKNVLGAVFLAAGIIMLFVPGQGIITILLGLTFLNFPGKRRLEKALIRRPAVHRAINWMRSRAGRPPLQIPAPPPRG